MNTTQAKGRGGHVCADEGVLETSLRLTRKQLIATSKYLEQKLDELFESERDFDDEKVKLIQSAIEKTQKAMQTVMDLEAKLKAREAGDSGAAINLDEARAEIESRLARLAA